MIHIIFFSLQLDRTVSLEQYGFVVAADALGQLIFSPIFGIIADRLDSIRLVSLICCLTFCLGNTLYANVALVPANLLGRAFDMVTKEEKCSLFFGRIEPSINQLSLNRK